jgi:hypothetical protein
MSCCGTEETPMSKEQNQSDDIIEIDGIKYKYLPPYKGEQYTDKHRIGPVKVKQILLGHKGGKK